MVCYERLIRGFEEPPQRFVACFMESLLHICTKLALVIFFCRAVKGTTAVESLLILDLLTHNGDVSDTVFVSQYGLLHTVR